jgi:hypothetical protein
MTRERRRHEAGGGASPARGRAEAHRAASQTHQGQRAGAGGRGAAREPAEPLAEVERLLGELTALLGSVNCTNLSVHLADGTTLTDALARRDALALHYAILSDLADAATVEINRYSRAEIKSHPTVQVSAIRKQMDALAAQRRELDTAIQATNWTTDLAE